jgi:Protein of unknown function (DUF1552)
MNRRMFMRGTGATLWLPFLPSALPRGARAAVPVEPRRALWYFLPNGFITDFVDPLALGENYDLKYAVQPLATLQSRVSIISGMDNRAAENYAAHEECLPTMLGDDYVTLFQEDGGTTVDQHAAKAIGSATPFGSLQLAAVDLGGSTVLLTVSYSSPTTPLSPIDDPRTAFNRMFAGTDPELTEEEIATRATLRRSVLDRMLERSNALAKKLNPEDLQKLDQFSTGVRELELQIDLLESIECPVPTEPNANPGLAESIAAMVDLMVVALQCDYTRILCLTTGASGVEVSYDFLGLTKTSHALSHGWASSDADAQELKTLYNYHVGQYTDLATKLAAIQTSDGDLLSHTMAHFVSEFGESNRHEAWPVTYLTAGGEAGGIVQGRHRRFTGVPHSNLWINTLDFLGVDPTGWGTTWTGPLDLYT